MAADRVDVRPWSGALARSSPMSRDFKE
jgi:hypothetical protein